LAKPQRLAREQQKQRLDRESIRRAMIIVTDKYWLIALCGTLIISVVPSVAHAADVAKGHKLAESVCSRCHGVTTHKKGWTNAPSFAEIANSPTTTSVSLEATIETPHSKMSGGAARSPAEAADLAAYILSLRRK